MLDFFLSFLMKYENNKAHNMDSLMLDPRFKNLHIILLLLERNKVFLLLKNMIRCPYILCWSNVMNICIL